MDSTRAHLGKSGRLVLPAEYRRALQLEPGDEVVLVLEGHEIRLLPPARAVKRAQALVHQFVPKARHLANELLHERRREVRRDSSKRVRPRKGA
jgi:AbrB family looped-hinge helix DNA binding protein